VHTWHRLRDEILEAYGAQCACCGETHKIFLTIDHVFGGGRKHVRKTGSRLKTYQEIIKQGFPPDFQVLCWNCNWAKSNGGCPHTILDMSG